MKMIEDPFSWRVAKVRLEVEQRHKNATMSGGDFRRRCGEYCCSSLPTE